MTALATTVNLLQLFGEPTRLRLVAVLARAELTVAELTAVSGLAQSRVSTHLGKLREAGVLVDRKAGASTYYALNAEAMPQGARELWTLVGTQVDDDVLEADRARAAALVRARDARAAWPDAVAGEMERHYSPGRTWESLARGLVGLVRLGDVLDAGCGDGTIAQLLAPRARRIVAVDHSERLIAAAKRRLARHAHVSCRVADLHDLPFPDGSFDQVLLFHVLTDVARPPRVLAECARVLRPGGGVVAIALAAHGRMDVASAYRHAHPGFTPAGLRRLFTAAGLGLESCEITSRERREPHFEVITAVAVKPARKSPKKKDLKS